MIATRFIVDAQLPPALARQLSSKGEGAIHVLDKNMMESSDSLIWELALRENLVIITKDEDFQMRASISTEFPTIIWVRIGNSSKKSLLHFFDKKWERIKQELANGSKLIELV